MYTNTSPRKPSSLDSVQSCTLSRIHIYNHYQASSALYMSGHWSNLTLHSQTFSSCYYIGNNSHRWKVAYEWGIIQSGCKEGGTLLQTACLLNFTSIGCSKAHPGPTVQLFTLTGYTLASIALTCVYTLVLSLSASSWRTQACDGNS